MQEAVQNTSVDGAASRREGSTKKYNKKNESPTTRCHEECQQPRSMPQAVQAQN